MTQIPRDRLIKVCSELCGKSLELVPHKGRFQLATSERDLCVQFLGRHGVDKDIPVGSAHRILRNLATATGDSTIYERGKKLLRDENT